MLGRHTHDRWALNQRGDTGGLEGEGEGGLGGGPGKGGLRALRSPMVVSDTDGKADNSRAAKTVYAGLESSGVLHRVHDILQTHLKMRAVDPACYDFVPLQFWYVFAHVYTASQDDIDGLASHVDDAVYGAAVWSLSGDNGQPGLWWKRSFRSEDYQIPVPMEAGDLALILRGTHHGVSRVPREKDRVTLSFHA